MTKDKTIKALRDALTKIIDMNVQYAIDKYGTAQKAESMACVTVARSALTLTADASEDAPAGENILARTAKLEDFRQSDPHDYAQFLAYVLWRDHYKDVSPDFTIQAHKWGVMSQIDNMLAGLTRKVAAARPAPVRKGDGND